MGDAKRRLLWGYRVTGLSRLPIGSKFQSKGLLKTYSMGWAGAFGNVVDNKHMAQPRLYRFRKENHHKHRVFCKAAKYHQQYRCMRMIFFLVTDAGILGKKFRVLPTGVEPTTFRLLVRTLYHCATGDYRKIARFCVTITDLPYRRRCFADSSLRYLTSYRN